MKNKVVVGLGFGDEGKGLFTDYLCHQYPDSLVIRYSGGHQCGHTVVTDNVEHVFSNFGSGTLRNVPTYWSRYCTVEPIGFIRELTLLKQKNINPFIYINKECPITTPYDIEHNKQQEKSNLHGSCGVGFGATIEREENHYSLQFGDLFYPDIFEEKLRAIGDYYNFPASLTEFVECSNLMTTIKNVELVFFDLPEFPNYIFEGSQGLLLDQNFGFFPNVTRANTGCRNVLRTLFSNDFEIFLVTRAYQTRHGNGFMTNENLGHNIKINLKETNKIHPWQGKFRRSMLDVSLLEYAINKDVSIYKNTKNLVITCLDHIESNYGFTYKGNIISCSNETEFINKIANILRITDVYISKTNNSKNIIKWR